jgi:hypothetical protein
MNKILSIALLVAGIALIAYGLDASHSIGSDVSRAVTGQPTDRSMWLLIGGIVAVVLGGGGLLVGRKPGV